MSDVELQLRYLLAEAEAKLEGIRQVLHDHLQFGDTGVSFRRIRNIMLDAEKRND